MRDRGSVRAYEVSGGGGGPYFEGYRDAFYGCPNIEPTFFILARGLDVPKTAALIATSQGKRWVFTVNIYPHLGRAFLRIPSRRSARSARKILTRELLKLLKI